MIFSHNRKGEQLRSLPGKRDNRLFAEFFGAFILSLLLMISVSPAQPAFASNGRPDSFADLAEKLMPAVVNISTTQHIKPSKKRQQALPPNVPPGSPFEEFFRDFFNRNQGDNAPREMRSLGSGFLIDSAGYLVTNNHVIDKADEIMISLDDGTELEAELVGVDKETDLALLKISSEKALPFVTFGDSDKVRVGEWALAVGNPFGLSSTVTAGIVSAKSRHQITQGNYDAFIQTDAPINKGNSGGPLFNMAGEVIGVNSVIYSPNGGSIGIGFAIPSNLVNKVVADLRNYKEVRRGWLGVTIQTVNETMAEAMGLEEAMGALVGTVVEDSPAAKAGIEPGDLILSFDGQKIKTMPELPRIVADTKIGKKAKVEVLREGKKKTLTVLVAKREADKLAELQRAQPGSGQAEEEDILGMDLAPLTEEQRERLDLEDEAGGVLVKQVERGSAAYEAGIRAGDVLLKISGMEVNSPGETEETIEALREKGVKSALVYMFSPRAGYGHRGLKLEEKADEDREEEK